MKAYDLVIATSLEELIEVTNEAKLLGYEPIGGIIEMHEKFIQTININQKPKKKMSEFFKQLAEEMQDKENVSLRITKIGENLTILTTTSKKAFTVTGSGEDADAGLFAEIVKVKSSKGLQVSEAVDAPENEEEEEGQNEQEEGENKKFSPKEKNKIRTDIKKLVKDAEALVKKKSYKEAVQAYVNAIALSKSINIDCRSIESAKKKALSCISPNDQAPSDKKEVATETETEETIEEENENEEEEQEVLDDDNKVNDKAEAQNKQRIFNSFMTAGAEAMKDRKYEKAVESFKAAVEIFPDDKTAKEELKKAEGWVKAVADL